MTDKLISSKWLKIAIHNFYQGLKHIPTEEDIQAYIDAAPSVTERIKNDKRGIIDGLKYTVEMFLFDPNTGEKLTEPRNDMDKITIDACRGAIELLELETPDNDDLISRQAVINALYDMEIIKYRYEIEDIIRALPAFILQKSP